MFLRKQLQLTLISVIAIWVSCAAATAQASVRPGSQFGERFQVLTSQIFPSSEHRLTNRFSFPKVYENKQRLSAKYGIDWALLSAPVFQSDTGTSSTYADNELDLLFSWRLFDTAVSTGKIFFYGIWVQTLSRLPTSAFAQSQGVITLPNRGGTDPVRVLCPLPPCGGAKLCQRLALPAGAALGHQPLGQQRILRR